MSHLVHARSTRVTHFDPPVHGATLLHYVAANGIEGYRQKTPPNAVAVARLLLERGAEPDALAGMYGGRHATMSMLVSSEHPAVAGLQVALVDTLVDFGASVEARGSGAWASPLMTALAFGYSAAADALVRRGARVDTLSAAAGLGRLADAQHLLAAASSEDRHRALVLAAQQGHAKSSSCCWTPVKTRTGSTPRGTTRIRRRSIRPRLLDATRSCECWWREAPASTSATRSTTARRSVGRATAGTRTSPSTARTRRRVGIAPSPAGSWGSAGHDGSRCAGRPCAGPDVHGGSIVRVGQRLLGGARDRARATTRSVVPGSLLTTAT